MAVITISVTPSERQLVSGIPQFVAIATNIAAIIFYTLDGTDPSEASSVYTDQIEMPRDVSAITLKVYATNGTDSSSVLALTYKTVLDGMRKAQATVSFLESEYMYTSLIGGSSYARKVQYSQEHMGILDKSNVPNTVQDGYGPYGEFPVQSYDQPISSSSARYSETDRQGNYGRGIGTFNRTEVVYLPPDPETTKLSAKSFNPRAMVLFADSREPTDTVHLFRPLYYDARRVGDYYETYETDGNRLTTGTFLKQYFNPRDNTITYYFRDSRTNRWIISVESASIQPTNEQASHLFNVAPAASEQGAGYIYRWIFFKGGAHLT